MEKAFSCEVMSKFFQTPDLHSFSTKKISTPLLLFCVRYKVWMWIRSAFPKTQMPNQTNRISLPRCLVNSRNFFFRKISDTVTFSHIQKSTMYTFITNLCNYNIYCIRNSVFFYFIWKNKKILAYYVLG